MGSVRPMVVLPSFRKDRRSSRKNTRFSPSFTSFCRTMLISSNNQGLMKILFLDIDGVCNSEDTLRKSNGGIIGIDPYMAFLVGKITLDTGCEVVLSSSWKHSEESVEWVKKRVVDLLDLTPDLPYEEGKNERGWEIKAWLDKHPEVTRYAILDDNSDMLPEQFPNFFKTDWKVGITKEISDQIIKHLNDEHEHI